MLLNSLVNMCMALTLLAGYQNTLDRPTRPKDPNGIAQKTRRDAKSLFDFEQLIQADINSHDPTIPPPEIPPIIIDGKIYDSKCYAKPEE